MTTPDKDAAALLKSLGETYISFGQRSRGLVLLLIANRIAPNDGPVLLSLAAALIDSGAAIRALNALSRLNETDHLPMVHLLRAKAHWLLHDHAGARRSYSDYIAVRSGE